MKLIQNHYLLKNWWSPSTRKAWIEIDRPLRSVGVIICRLPHGRRGLKLSLPEMYTHHHRSPSTRKAWIEIFNARIICINCTPSPSTRKAWIEMLKVSVLNINKEGGRLPHGRRGLKLRLHHMQEISPSSPSTRKAWIEIFAEYIFDIILWSPSTRKAWIEIPLMSFIDKSFVVAFHTEGVD